MPAAAASPLADPLTRRRRRYHFHLPGVVYGLTTVFLAVGAINSQNNLLFWAFGLAIAGLLVSGVISGAALMGVELERLPVEPVNAGAPLVVRYRVRNRNRLFPAFALHIDEQPDTRDASADWRATIAFPGAFVAHVGPSQTVETEARVTTLARGQTHLDRVSVWTVFPFGLSRKSVVFAQRRRIVVRPAPIALDGDLIRPAPGQGALASRSQRRSPTPGEFFALREHREGDSPRSVAWRASARTGTLMSRQFTAARAARVWIVLELGPDAALGERAISLAAGAVEAARARASPVGLVVAAAGLRTPAREGRGHADALLDALATLPGAAPAHAAANLDHAPGDIVLFITAAESVTIPHSPGVVVLRAAEHAPAVTGVAV